MKLKEYIDWLTRMVERSRRIRDLRREHWAFCQSLKKVREVSNPPKGLDPDKLVILRAVYDLTENDMNHMRYGVKDKKMFEGIAEGLVKDILKYSEKKVTESPNGSKTYELVIHLYNNKSKK